MSRNHSIKCDCCEAEEQLSPESKFTSFIWTFSPLITGPNLRTFAETFFGMPASPHGDSRAIDLCPTCRQRMEEAIDAVLMPPPPSPPAAEIKPAAEEPPSVLESIADVEQRHIISVLNYLGWNKSQAARTLGIERSTLDRKLREYNVSRPQPVESEGLPTNVPPVNLGTLPITVTGEESAVSAGQMAQELADAALGGSVSIASIEVEP